MKIGVDIDGVTCQLHEEICKVIEKDYGVKMTVDEINCWDYSKDGVSIGKVIREQYRNGSDIVTKMKPVRGAQDAIERLSDLGHQITFITGRPKDYVGKQTKQWLMENIGDFKLAHAPAIGDKCKLYDVDVLIDDNWDEVNACRNKYGKKAILYDRPWNRQQEPPGVVRASDWKQVLEILGASSSD